VEANCGLEPTLSPNNIKVIEMPKEESLKREGEGGRRGWD